MQVRTRLAPSPTGYPHVGTILQALINYIYAKKHHGKFLIRIEDTDRQRFVSDAEDALFQALAWLGLTPDESPRHGGSYGPYRQSERLSIYQKYAQQLVQEGKAYYCFCSPQRLAEVRKAKQKQGLPPMYDKHCRSLDPQLAARRAIQESHVIRLKVPPNQKIVVHDEIRGDIEFDSNLIDDQVLLKSDGFPTYHLAVVVDDHLMKITHVVRGEEWLSSAPKHFLLYQYFGWQPPRFVHTPTLRNPDKSKLSKRHGHSAVSWYIDKGYLPEALSNFLLSRVWTHPQGQEIYSLQDIMPLFELQDLHIQGPIVDLAKLDWYNGLYIRSLSDEELLTRLQKGHFIPSDCPLDLAKRLLPLIKERIVTLSEFEDLTAYFYRSISYDPHLLLKKTHDDKNLVINQLHTTLQSLQSLQSWSEAELEKIIRQLAHRHSWRPPQYFMMIRIAISGRKATPPLFSTMEALGRSLTLNRLQQALTTLQNLAPSH